MIGLKSKETRGIAVLEVSGKLIGGPDSSERFRDYFKKLVADGERKAVVDLRGATWATSQGIGMLIGAYTSMKNAGGELVLASVGDRIKDILNVTRLINIFELFDNEDDAVKHLIGESGGSANRQRLDTAPELGTVRYIG